VSAGARIRGPNNPGRSSSDAAFFARAGDDNSRDFFGHKGVMNAAGARRETHGPIWRKHYQGGRCRPRSIRGKYTLAWVPPGGETLAKYRDRKAHMSAWDNGDTMTMLGHMSRQT